MQRKATPSTPEVDLTFANGRGHIRGPIGLAPTNLQELFHSVHDHIDRELQNDQGRTFEIDIDLDDTPSTVMPHLKLLFEMIKSYKEAGVEVAVRWYFDKRRQSSRELADTLRDLYYAFLTIYEKN